MYHLWNAYDLAGIVLLALGQNALLSFSRFLVFIVLQLYLDPGNCQGTQLQHYVTHSEAPSRSVRGRLETTNPNGLCYTAGY